MGCSINLIRHFLPFSLGTTSSAVNRFIFVSVVQLLDFESRADSSSVASIETNQFRLDSLLSSEVGRVKRRKEHCSSSVDQVVLHLHVDCHRNVHPGSKLWAI